MKLQTPAVATDDGEVTVVGGVFGAIWVWSDAIWVWSEVTSFWSVVGFEVTFVVLEEVLVEVDGDEVFDEVDVVVVDGAGVDDVEVEVVVVLVLVEMDGVEVEVLVLVEELVLVDDVDVEDDVGAVEVVELDEVLVPLVVEVLVDVEVGVVDVEVCVPDVDVLLVLVEMDGVEVEVLDGVEVEVLVDEILVLVEVVVEVVLVEVGVVIGVDVLLPAPCPGLLPEFLPLLLPGPWFGFWFPCWCAWSAFSSAARVFGPKVPSAGATAFASWNLMSAALVSGPKYVVSFPGEPGPEAATVKPRSFNAVWRH